MRKIFKGKAFQIGVFLGGPIVAGYLFSENFKTLGEYKKVKPTWILTILATIIIFASPESSKIPSSIIPITYTAITYWIFHKVQSEKVDQYINSGGLIHNWKRVIGVSIIGLIITFSLIFTIAYTYESVKSVNIRTKTYGATIKHEIDFDQSNISEKEVDEIANGLIKTDFFDLAVAKYIYVVKDRDRYVLYISVIEGLENDPYALQPFIELRSQMDDYIPNKKIEINLVVDYLDNVVKTLK